MILTLYFSVAIDSTKLSPPKSDEIKDGQWLGVIVRSQGIGGKVMVLFKHIYITYFHFMIN